MKSRTPSVSTRKTLGIAVLAGVLMSAGLAQADGRSCLLDSPAQNSAQAPAASYSPEVLRQMSRIDQAMREGLITPYEAGQLMRRQWEIAQFQRGFQGDAQSTRSGGCGLSPELAAKIAPLVGDMAKNGMQTATTVMRALKRETERLLQEPEQPEAPAF